MTFVKKRVMQAKTTAVMGFHKGTSDATVSPEAMEVRTGVSQDVGWDCSDMERGSVAIVIRLLWHPVKGRHPPRGKCSFFSDHEHLRQEYARYHQCGWDL